MIDAHIIDGAALTKFIYWIKNVNNKKINEIDAKNKLEKYRKKIYKSVNVNPLQFHKTNFRAENKHPNHSVINTSIQKLEEMRDTAKDYFDNGQWSLNEVENYLRGLSRFNNVDEYIETEIKTTEDFKNRIKEDLEKNSRFNQ